MISSAIPSKLCRGHSIGLPHHAVLDGNMKLSGCLFAWCSFEVAASLLVQADESLGEEACLAWLTKCQIVFTSPSGALIYLLHA